MQYTNLSPMRYTSYSWFNLKPSLIVFTTRLDIYYVVVP